MQTVDVGETYWIVTQWWDENRKAKEPTEITLTITTPSGTVIVVAKGAMTTTDVAPDELATWEYPQTVTEEGVWRYTALGKVDGVDVTQDAMFLAGAGSRSPGPCEPWACWADVEQLCPTVDLSSISLGARELLLDNATWILYSLDGSRYPGICEATRRFCRTCNTCRRFALCCCSHRNAIDLGGGRYPVWGVWDVTIDGEILPSSAYTIRARRYLDRVDGERWPTCSDLSDPDSFTASWAFGLNPPIGLANAAAIFTAELAKSCLDEDCEIPQRVTSLQREGVNYVILDSQKFFDEGRTGVYAVDLALIAAKQGREARPGGGSPLLHGPATRVI